MERSRILKMLQNMTTWLVPEVTSKYKAQETGMPSKPASVYNSIVRRLYFTSKLDLLEKGLRKAKALSLKQ